MKMLFIIMLFIQTEWISHDYRSELWIEFKANSTNLTVEREFINALSIYKKVSNKYYMLISYSPLKEINELRQRELYKHTVDFDSTLYKNMFYKYDLNCNIDSFKIEFKLIN